MKQILIDYDEYLELEQKSKKLDEIKENIELIATTQNFIKVRVNDKLDKILVLLKQENYLKKV